MPGPEQPGPPVDSEEQQRREALTDVIDQYLDVDDKEFLEEIEDEVERLGYVFGRLLEQGEDPTVIFKEQGITEEDDEIYGE